MIADPPDDLSGFPEAVLGTPVSLWRVHRHREPWYFASEEGGRFDLEAPRGTCYLSTDPSAAFLEGVGPLIAAGVALSSQAVRERWLSELRIAEQLRLADLTDPAALGRFGVTAEISVAVDYPQTVKWARALDRAGFAGIRYVARRDPSARGRSVALFGEAGSATLGETVTGVLSDAGAFWEVVAEYGIQVAPRDFG